MQTIGSTEMYTIFLLFFSFSANVYGLKLNFPNELNKNDFH